MINFYRYANLYILRLTFIAIVLSLSGCHPLAPVAVPNIKHYTLNQYPHEIFATHKNIQSLAVAIPQVDSALSTTNMHYTDKAFTLQAFTRSNWANPPAHMLQLLMVQTLRHSQLFHTVLKEPQMGHHDYRLTSELHLLQQEFIGTHSHIHLQLSAALVNSTTHKIIATRLFDITKAACCNTAYGGVIAANQASLQLLQQLNHFIYTHLNNHAKLLHATTSSHSNITLPAPVA